MQLRRQRRRVAIAIDDRDVAVVVGVERVIGEGDEPPVPREPRVRDVAARFVQRLADRELEALAPFGAADDGQVRAVGCPVGFAHVLCDGTGRATEQGHPGERPLSHPAFERMPEGHGQLPLRRDRQQKRVRKVEPRRPRSVAAREPGADRLTVPRGRIDEALSVCSEPAAPDRAVLVRETHEVRRGRCDLLRATP